MEKHDYYAEVRSDIEEYLDDQGIEGRIDDDLMQKLEDDMFVSDSVTGNASGSYTFSSYKAEENLCHNWDLMAETAAAFGLDAGDWVKGAEYWDVTVRCYLLGQILPQVVRERNAHLPEEDDEDEA